MQEHIQWLKEVVEISKAQNVSQDVINALEYCIEGAQAKLEIEKKQIVEAWNKRGSNIVPKYFLEENINGEQYYTETFKSENEKI